MYLKFAAPTNYILHKSMVFNSALYFFDLTTIVIHTYAKNNSSLPLTLGSLFCIYFRRMHEVQRVQVACGTQTAKQNDYSKVTNGL